MPGLTEILHSCSGLQLVSVPMFSCLRKLVLVIIPLYEFITHGKAIDKETIVAVLVVAISTVAAGWDTLTSEVVGYVFTMLNNVLSAANQVAVSMLYIAVLLSQPKACLNCFYRFKS